MKICMACLCVAVLVGTIVAVTNSRSNVSVFLQTSLTQVEALADVEIVGVTNQIDNVSGCNATVRVELKAADGSISVTYQSVRGAENLCRNGDGTCKSYACYANVS